MSKAATMEIPISSNGDTGSLPEDDGLEQVWAGGVAGRGGCRGLRGPRSPRGAPSLSPRLTPLCSPRTCSR